MTIIQNTDTDNLDNLESELANDQTGLAEIQKAMDEIEKLNQQEIEEVNGETEEETQKDDEVGEVEQDATAEEPGKKGKKEELKLWKERKAKYSILAEKEALIHENSQLKNMLNEALNSGTYHYSKNAFSDLAKAKEDKKRAIEEGDIDALIDADLALTKAISTVNEIEKWSYNDKQNQQPTHQAQNYQPQEDNFYTPSIVEQEIASDWLDGHSYLHPASPDYNSTLANQVADFIHYLDDNIKKSGRRDSYYSEEYFRAIDNYIGDIQSKSQKTAQKVESAGHIGGVRKSYSAPSSGRNSGTAQVTLTADEKIMCANAGIPEKEWAKYKLEQYQESKRGR